MSTIFNVRNLKLPALSRASIIVGTIVVILGLIAAVVGWQVFKRLTTNTVVAYFPPTLALYPGDKTKVTFTYSSKYKVPANVTASILNPSLVASRTIQLAPPYTGGPELED